MQPLTDDGTIKLSKHEIFSRRSMLHDTASFVKPDEWSDLPGVPAGLLLQQQLLLLAGELQVQLKGVAVQVMDVLLDVAGGSLGQQRGQHRQSLRGTGVNHLHAAELTQEVIILPSEKFQTVHKHGVK